MKHLENFIYTTAANDETGNKALQSDIRASREVSKTSWKQELEDKNNCLVIEVDKRYIISEETGELVYVGEGKTPNELGCFFAATTNPEFAENFLEGYGAYKLTLRIVKLDIIKQSNSFQMIPEESHTPLKSKV